VGYNVYLKILLFTNSKRFLSKHLQTTRNRKFNSSYIIYF